MGVRLGMWVRIGRVLGCNEAVDGIPVPVRHVSSGMLSPGVQGTAPALSRSPPFPEIC